MVRLSVAVWPPSDVVVALVGAVGRSHDLRGFLSRYLTPDALSVYFTRTIAS